MTTVSSLWCSIWHYMGCTSQIKLPFLTLNLTSSMVLLLPVIDLFLP